MKRKANLFVMMSMSIVIFIFMIFQTTAHAIVEKKQKNVLEKLEFRADEFNISQTNVPIDEIMNRLTTAKEWRSFFQQNKDGYVYIDPRSGRPSSVTTTIPIIPGTGTGNNLTLQDISKELGYPVKEINEHAIQNLVLKFLAEHSGIMNLNMAEVGRMKVANPSDHIWSAFISRQVNGIQVRDSDITIMINHGNIVLWGMEKWGDIDITTIPAISKETAIERGFSAARGKSDKDTITVAPHLQIVPVNPLSWNGSIGNGYDYRLVWAFTFTRKGYANTWEVLVDAYNGTLLSFQDLNQYVLRRIAGSIYTRSVDGCPPDGTAARIGMPFANHGLPAPNGAIDINGLYDWVSGVPTTTLAPTFDNCGAISESSTTGDGVIELGGTDGQHDCTKPPGHSSGDTFAARTSFTELTFVNRTARSWLASVPGVTANVNGNSTCNAYASGNTIYFYRSGGGCRNTGEIAAIMDHEWGHALDYNDANGSLSNPSDAYGDGLAALRLHTSCIGRGFWSTYNTLCGLWTCPTNGQQLGYNCTGYGDCCTDCTGIRDIDFAKHASGTPHTINNYTCSNCGGGGGPCGKEVHCEAIPVDEAVWDIAGRDLESAPFNYDRQTSFLVGSRIFLIGSGNVTNWFTCNCSGISDGCGATNGYMQFITADDNDGNINNGTPHMTAIYNAFDRHGIACSTPTPQNTVCEPTSAPVLTVTPGDNSAQLSWTAVSGATYYAVFKTIGVVGCDFGKIKLATTTSTTYSDLAMNGVQSSYVIQAVGSNAACLSPLSNCVAITPAVGGTPPGTVPDSDLHPGAALILGKSGSQLILDWTAPGGTCITQDYGIYRGSLPWSGYNHISLLCSTGGLTDFSISADSGSYYYLIVAQNASQEGSYGLDSSGTQRPAGSSSCYPQVIGSCN